MESKIRVFQTDSAIVQKVFAENSNYRIEYSGKNPVGEKYCALYFSSNDIYYPNLPQVFTHQIVQKDKYEWFKTRITYASKHIYLRDIKKQWYLGGINAQLNTIEKLLDFLKIETEGYSTAMSAFRPAARRPRSAMPNTVSCRVVKIGI